MTRQRVCVSCPNCRRDLQVRAENLGRDGLCKHCGHKFRADAEHALLVPTYMEPPAANDNERVFLELRANVLEFELQHALAELASRTHDHRAAADELKEAASRLTELELRHATHGAERERLRALASALEAELSGRQQDIARLTGDREARADEVARLTEQLAALERALAQVTLDRDRAHRRLREQHDRSETECIALATEVARLQDRLSDLECEQNTTLSEHQRAVEAERLTREELLAVHQQLLAERDTLARKSEKLRQRLDTVEEAHIQLGAKLKRAQARLGVAARDRALIKLELKQAGRRWQAERSELQALLRRERQELLLEADRRIEEVQDVERARWTTDREALLEEMARLCERLSDLERVQAESTSDHERARASWDAERLTLLAEAERSLAAQAEQFETERRLWSDQHQTSPQRSRRQKGTKAELAQLLAEVERELEQRRAKDRETAIERTSLQHQLAEAARERAEVQQCLGELGRERDTLDAALSAARAAIARGQEVALSEVDRLRRVALNAARQQQDALRQLEEAREENARLLDREAQWGGHNGHASEDGTLQAGAHLAGLLSQISNLEFANGQERVDLITELRTVRAALTSRMEHPTEVLAGRPRSQSHAFDAPEQYRAELVDWLHSAQECRQETEGRVDRLKSEMESARKELDLVNRDLALSDWPEQDGVQKWR